jgi:hypothetical protein
MIKDLKYGSTTSCSRRVKINKEKTIRSILCIAEPVSNDFAHLIKNYSSKTKRVVINSEDFTLKFTYISFINQKN